MNIQEDYNDENEDANDPEYLKGPDSHHRIPDSNDLNDHDNAINGANIVPLAAASHNIGGKSS